jgi:hypothetical protein
VAALCRESITHPGSVQTTLLCYSDTMILLSGSSVLRDINCSLNQAAFWFWAIEARGALVRERNSACNLENPNIKPHAGKLTGSHYDLTTCWFAKVAINRVGG